MAIQNDDLHKYEVQKRKDAEYSILTAAQLIAPLVEETFSEGNKKYSCSSLNDN